MSTHSVPFLNIKKKITLNYSKSATMGFFFQGTQERVRNSRGKRAISVRATEVLLYIQLITLSCMVGFQNYMARHLLYTRIMLLA